MGFFDKLKQGLNKTKNAIVGKADEIFKKFIKIDEADPKHHMKRCGF